MVNKYYKKQRIASKRSTGKVPKSFWRRKKKDEKTPLDRYKNLSGKEKQKKVEYTRYYYLETEGSLG